MTVRIIHAHVLDGLAQLPDESVHCVVTSPPYFGLRSYGTGPQVWGRDPACKHEWGEGFQHTGGAGKQGKTSQRAGRSNAEALETARDAGAFCHCGAWRGELGLEPNPDLYVDHLVTVFREGLVEEPGGGLHFVGPSQLGKTTLLRVGGSVWGGSQARRCCGSRTGAALGWSVNSDDCMNTARGR